jgi:hypothetical protein
MAFKKFTKVENTEVVGGSAALDARHNALDEENEDLEFLKSVQAEFKKSKDAQCQ